jgi:methylated-DNA-[protein]-cysteine S-methyltransferase
VSFYDIYDSDIGPVFIGASDAGVQRIDFITADHDEASCVEALERDAGEPATRDHEALAGVSGQLRQYFDGRRREFELPLAPAGTDFQQRVWRALREIPLGTTATYGHIASMVGNPKAARAVGAANGRNPISIVVPCHRVVGADGTLTGYASGLARKRWLLDHEQWSMSLARDAQPAGT